MKISQIGGEFALIDRLMSKEVNDPAIVKGVGDDCALVDVANGMDLAVSTDTMVSGTHFFSDVDPETLGHKALAVNLSDMAAMGAMPYNLARAQTSREAAPRRIMVAFRAGIDDATLATFGHDRMSVDRAGRAGFPL